MGLTIHWVHHGHLMLMLELVVVLNELLVLDELILAVETIIFSHHLWLGYTLLAKLMVHLMLVSLHLLLLRHNGLLILLLLME